MTEKRTLKIGRFVIIAVLLSPFISFGYREVVMWYWDSKVEAWCETEGGLTVYQTVEIRLSEHPGLKIESNGTLSIPNETRASLDDRFITSRIRTELSGRRPHVRRSETVYQDRLNDVVLGRRLFFSRYGGDFFLNFADTSSGCDDIPGFYAESRAKNKDMFVFIEEL